MSTINIREAVPDDFHRILELNENEVEWTSPMDMVKLNSLHKLASYHKVAEVSGKVLGFLLAINSEQNYINDNFSWFKNRYSRFYYIDRIVIDTDSKGLGLGRSLYLDLFEQAKAQDIAVVGCEYNLQPLNKASNVFHEKLGFKQVGERICLPGVKVVSMQAAQI